MKCKFILYQTSDDFFARRNENTHIVDAMQIRLNGVFHYGDKLEEYQVKDVDAILNDNGFMAIMRCVKLAPLG